jgi:hypothetical protein
MKQAIAITIILSAVVAVYFLYYKPTKDKAAAEAKKAMDDQRNYLLTPHALATGVKKVDGLSLTSAIPTSTKIFTR